MSLDLNSLVFVSFYNARFIIIKRDYKYFSDSANINHKGLQRTANEYAEERRIYKDLGPVVRTRVIANPGLNFNPGFFFLTIKSILSDNFLYFFSISNHQIVGKENSTELAF